MISGKKRELDPRFPWVLGFRPPRAYCPNGEGHVVTFTGQREEKTGNHVYHCYTCGADFASFTRYAYCDKHERLIEKDELYTPCMSPDNQCSDFMPVGDQNLSRCHHFIPVQEADIDYNDLRRLEETMKTFRTPKYQPGSPDVSGMNTELLKKARRERLKRLEEGKE